ncbi:ABC transporter permease subunit [Sulfitobacter sp. BDSS02]|uniref:ABC transporter permease n=1 Tax=Heliomarina sp. TaxID=2917556 RepID=UPI00405952A9|nr:ABC transporter permease subunit [Sulfitobacter sp. BDSS02]MBR9847963.1 ABC transporter permease [Paracoccaceae bacterium]
MATTGTSAAHAQNSPGRLTVNSIMGSEGRYWLLIAPAVLLMLGFYFYPLARVLWMSFTFPTPGLGNYEDLIDNASVHRTLITTARIGVITTGLTLIFAYLISYVLVHAKPKVERIMFLGVLIPLWISALVRGFSWFILLRREGTINDVLISTGIIDTPLDLIWNELGVVIGMVHYMLPLGVLPIYANMRNIDTRCVAAARGLGASRGVAFRKVFLPLSMPGVIGAGILVFIYSLGFYVTPALLGGGKTLMIAEYIQLQIMDLVNWGRGAMLATTLLVTILLLLGVMSRIIDLRGLFGGK